MTFLESIKVKDGQCYLLDYHQDRIDRTAHQYGFTTQIWSLKDQVSKLEIPPHGIFKLRLVYHASTIQMGLQPYTIRPVKKLQLVHDDQIEYASKFVDRKSLSGLFSKRGAADDIIIVKNGLLTDSYYANLAFLKENKWYTPKLPLLAGTKRQFYLEENILSEADISPADIAQFEKIALINAMIDLEDQVWIESDQVYFEML